MNNPGSLNKFTQGSTQLGQGPVQQPVTVDRKAATSDRRKVQMKWCEEQRFKIQRECDELVSAKHSIDKLLDKMAVDSDWVKMMAESVEKQMKPGECDNPLPPGFSFLDFCHLFAQEEPTAQDGDNNK